MEVCPVRSVGLDFDVPRSHWRFGGVVWGEEAGPDQWPPSTKFSASRRHVTDLESKMSTPEERDVERKRKAEKALHREVTVKRIKDIVWTAVIATVITIIVVTSLGWLTTQRVVEKAREEGVKELVALRASICLVRFQQRPDAEAKLAEFKALSYSDRDAAIQKFLTDEGLATMLGEDVPVSGAIDNCAGAIKRL